MIVFAHRAPGTPRTMREKLTSERGAVGWLVLGIVLGAVLVIWLIVQLFDAIF